MTSDCLSNYSHNGDEANHRKNFFGKNNGKMVDFVFQASQKIGAAEIREKGDPR